MKLNKLIVMLAVISTIARADVVSIDLGWLDAKFAVIQSAVDGIVDNFEADRATYLDYKQRANSVKNAFNARDAARRDLLECVRAQFAARNTELAGCQGDTVELQAQIVADLQALQEQLDALSHSTTLEINSLTTQRDQLTVDLTTLQTAYNNGVGANSDKASVLLSDLKAISSKYKQMINKKSDLLEEIEELRVRINEHRVAADLELREAQTDLCA